MSTLYRKYRPQDFSAVVGQEIVVKTLQNALVADKPAHSYLFTGPRGTGKTSLARIFAKSLNCKDRQGADACGKCAHCQAVAENQSLDIIEIDAASYTGVDNIRSLRETMNNAPLLGRYKIYIIDEVHMLSIGAFNALLKIMEEPPEHVIFLLATTELHKVPKTILSRCQRFDLRKFTLTEILRKLETVVAGEKLDVEPEALTLIAKNSGGALRDAESLLTQLATLADGHITPELVQTALGVSDREVLYTLLQNFTEGNIEAVLLTLKSLEESGKNSSPLTKDLVDILRDVLLFKAHQKFDLDPLSLLTDTEQASTKLLATQLSYRTLTTLLEALEEALVKMKGSTFGFLPLEIALVQALPVSTETKEESNKDQEPPAPKAPAEKKVAPKESQAETEEEAPKPAPQKAEVAKTLRVSPSSHSVSLDAIQREWKNIIEKVKLLNASLSVALQSAKPVVIEDDKLHISVKYKFHQERLNEPDHRLTLQEAFDTILGTHLAFCIVQEVAVEQQSAPKENTDPLVQHALDLLGGSVL